AEKCAPACGGGTTKCGGKCVDTAVDPQNGGGCALACPFGQVCSAGACALDCGGGTTKCGGKCVDTAVDPQNCGGCAKPCGPGQVCSASACALECTGGTSKCGGKCVDTAADPQNCGGCGAACGPGEACAAGKCALVCGAGTSKCGSKCADTAVDPQNCGGCGTPCGPGEVCSSGSCGLVCGGGTTKCGNKCADTQSDPANCGSCGKSCPGGNVCTAGSCQAVACKPNASEICYSAAPATINVGPCKAGAKTCKPDGSGFGPCAGEVTPQNAEDCNNNVDDDCNGLVNDKCKPQPPWAENGKFVVLTKPDGSLFSGHDCPGNFFGQDLVTVDGVPFVVGPYTAGGQMAGLEPGANVPAPNKSWLVGHVYVIFPGGRCNGQPLGVTFFYFGGGSQATSTANIPHDCQNGGQFGGPDFSIKSQGNYGGPCCDNWYMGRFDNPQPGKMVASIQVNYTDGCGGSYNGQIWALTVD
ncbi:MAG: hypothetical protein HY744_31565, partial [Deltaproteobacteria bacterium]|nr:hypothetical protein [Deltaproteobacteria bacterium]